MKYRMLLLQALLFSMLTFGQFRYDNVLFKTVDLSELCNTLNKNSGYLLLDVRSAGEYADTSRFAGYNLGHFEGAVNIDIRQLGPRIKELNEYKTRPVFVYCSHSQRSRRALKMLSDSGFTNLYNVNGGMSAIHYRALKDKECFPSLFKTKNTYQIISLDQLSAKISSKQPLVIVDVRPDSAFRHIAREPNINAIGTIRNSISIPMDSIPNNLSKLSKDKEIVLVDIYGDDAAKSAQYFVNNGYKKVSMLIEGMERILISQNDNPSVAKLYVSPIQYSVMNATQLGKRLATGPAMNIIDIRSADEFNNKHKEGWRNLGHIKNAIHIPANEIEDKWSTLEKTKPVLLYSIGSGPEVFMAANSLHKHGFTDVYVLMGGLFNLRWSSGNLKGEQQLADLVVDVPADNK